MKKLTDSQIADCYKSYLTFTQTMFEARHKKFHLNWHHERLFNAMERVFIGDCKRLMINIPPRHGKTELAVIYFIPWTLGIVPDSLNVFASATADLAREHSEKVRDIVRSPVYQQLFPWIKLKQDTQAKNNWKTDQDGAVFAAGIDGQLLGRGAGLHREKYGGCMIFDDPHKLEDVRYETKRKNTVDTVTSLVTTRRNNPDKTPVIGIMQRLHEEDWCGYINENEKEEWEIIKIPVYDKDRNILWPGFSPSRKELDRLEKVNPYLFNSQYMQEPTALEGSVFERSWWKYYTELPPLTIRFMTGDTAQKAKESSDWSVFQLWGFSKSEHRIYLIDQIRGKWEAPDLLKNIRTFWADNKDKHTGKLRALFVEDAVSGTGLMQTLDREPDPEKRIPVFPIKRMPNQDKVTRAGDAAPHVFDGFVYLPSNAIFLNDYMRELTAFNKDMSHKHDDQVDATTDAINLIFSSKKRRKALTI